MMMAGISKLPSIRTGIPLPSSFTILVVSVPGLSHMPASFVTSIASNLRNEALTEQVQPSLCPEHVHLSRRLGGCKWDTSTYDVLNSPAIDEKVASFHSSFVPNSVRSCKTCQFHMVLRRF